MQESDNREQIVSRRADDRLVFFLQRYTPFLHICTYIGSAPCQPWELVLVPYEGRSADPRVPCTPGGADIQLLVKLLILFGADERT